jgi:hypothetical protein
MRNLEILLPFGLPTPHLAADLLRELKLAALATLLAKAGKPVLHDFDPFSRMLPHEAWINCRINKKLNQAGNLVAATNSPPLASAQWKSSG